jgi:hypothetical protein
MLSRILEVVLAVALVQDRSPAMLGSPLQLVVERTELAEPLRPGELSRALTITLFNPGPKAVHGFAIQSMATFADGYTSYGGAQSDAYAFPVREDGRGGPIVAGARRTLLEGYSYRTGTTDVPVSVGARVVAVIFDDDTARGDEKQIQELFARRALNQRAWPTVQRIVDEAQAAGGAPRAVLERILAELTARSDDTYATPDAFRWTRSTIASNLEFTTDPARLLETVVSGVEEMRRATETHWQRRY